MKKNIFQSIILLMAIATTIVGCDSFLDDQPRGYAIAKELSHFEGMLNTGQNLRVVDYTRMLSPDIIVTEANIASFSESLGYDQYDVTSSENAYKLNNDPYQPAENCTFWEQCYNYIYNYNVIINGVMDAADGTESDKLRVQAEARVSRAWLHFVLAQVFAKPYTQANINEPAIPIVTEADTNIEDYGQPTIGELYNWIEQELTEAIPHLSDRLLSSDRIEKTTGYALLGKFYWVTAQYAKALDPLRQAYSQLKDQSTYYFQDFKALQEKYGYMELDGWSLFMENGATPDGLLCYPYANPEMLWLKQRSFMSIFVFGLYGTTPYHLNPAVYALFDDNDLRRNLIPTVGSFGESLDYPVAGIRDALINYGVELADVYLALAECEARAGSQSTAREVLADFRQYRVLSGHEAVPDEIQTQNELIRYCYEEIKREFFGRPQSFYTMRRLWDDPLFQDLKPYTHQLGGYFIG